MQLCSRQRFQTYCTYLGIALLNMTNELSWYWGNLVVYIDSYYFAYQPEVNNEAPWLISLFLCCWGVSLIVAAYLVKKFKQFHVAILGVAIYDVGMLSSFLAVQKNMQVLNFTMGAMCGFGYGVIQAVVFLWVRDLSSSANVAFAFSLVSTSLNLGGIFLNAIVTFYVNPTNLEAGLRVGSTKLFAETSIVDHVPSVFLVLGSINFAFHFVGMLIIRLSFQNGAAAATEQPNRQDKPKPEVEAEPEPEVDANGKGQGQRMVHDCETQPILVLESDKVLNSTDSDSTVTQRLSRLEGIDAKTTRTGTSYALVPSDAKISEKSYLNGTPSTWYHGVNEKDEVDEEQNEIGNKIGNKIGDKIRTCDEDPLKHGSPFGDKNEITTHAPHGECKSLTLREAMKTKKFYALCFALLSADMSYQGVFNFYKKFGELWIRNDYFLMSIGTASSFTNLLTRVFWGVLIDRKGVKYSAIFFSGSLAILFFTYYVSGRVQLLYAASTVSLTALSTAMYLIFPVAALKLFGSTYFSDNYGAVMSTTIITNLIAPSLIALILEHFGWLGLFSSLGMLNTLVLVDIIVGFPKE